MSTPQSPLLPAKGEVPLSAGGTGLIDWGILETRDLETVKCPPLLGQPAASLQQPQRRAGMSRCTIESGDPQTLRVWLDPGQDLALPGGRLLLGSFISVLPWREVGSL